MDRNEVTLVGRLSAKPEERPMPSGDTMTKWRIIVRRRPRARRGGLVDTIQCVTFDPEVASLVARMAPREGMEVRGSLRCRIYGPPVAKNWRYEVEVHSVVLVPAEQPSDPPATPEELRVLEAPEVLPASDLASVPPRPVAYLAATG
ncbi:single-stranded DNA-binding protein [Nonomuraea sp. NPDC049152]|uniref:single-stranded DNA-binding protein n=1 Tax=Nonomuraea sp. NPDC049152 TaxID=3154350 RepID=UPI0033DE05DA